MFTYQFALLFTTGYAIVAVAAPWIFTPIERLVPAVLCSCNAALLMITASESDATQTLGTAIVLAWLRPSTMAMHSELKAVECGLITKSIHTPAKSLRTAPLPPVPGFSLEAPSQQILLSS
ncbi:hypothetical protein GIB67_017316 [Kingdonia uniflora]|uniref:Uncharacterized protein n=1 Tax=Kingdonia uniflora TaxID=39325 RepID=A0A7J7N698_9MAGN|nr:hypothetical protein GIB67_017316 [Kingdonia uniflora]